MKLRQKKPTPAYQTDDAFPQQGEDDFEDSRPIRKQKEEPRQSVPAPKHQVVNPAEHARVSKILANLINTINENYRKKKAIAKQESKLVPPEPKKKLKQDTSQQPKPTSKKQPKQPDVEDAKKFGANKDLYRFKDQHNPANIKNLIPSVEGTSSTGQTPSAPTPPNPSKVGIPKGPATVTTSPVAPPQMTQDIANLLANLNHYNVSAVVQQLNRTLNANSEIVFRDPNRILNLFSTLSDADQRRLYKLKEQEQRTQRQQMVNNPQRPPNSSLDNRPLAQQAQQPRPNQQPQVRPQPQPQQQLQVPQPQTIQPPAEKKLFKRAAFHVAIAYHIHLKKVQEKGASPPEIDPTFHAKKLREAKNHVPVKSEFSNYKEFKEKPAKSQPKSGQSKAASQAKKSEAAPPTQNEALNQATASFVQPKLQVEPDATEKMTPVEQQIQQQQAGAESLSQGDQVPDESLDKKGQEAIPESKCQETQAPLKIEHPLEVETAKLEEPSRQLETYQQSKEKANQVTLQEPQFSQVTPAQNQKNINVQTHNCENIEEAAKAIPKQEVHQIQLKPFDQEIQAHKEQTLIEKDKPQS